MAGGLLNLIALGNQNIILNGNPTKSFFKTKYVKYTNFGMQKFRIDQQGQTTLSLNTPSRYTFKMARYGDLLMDTYLVVTLPDIWSPVLKYSNPSTGQIEYRPYEFQWIKNIGTQMISEVDIYIGGRLIQKFSGAYIQDAMERDFNTTKKAIFNEMTGNTTDLCDPANYSNRQGNYPNAFKLSDADVEPSIPARQLFIPINMWFSTASTLALPLICLQYAELDIVFTLRPLNELFTIRDVLSSSSYDAIPRIHAPQSKNEAYGFHRFIQPPPLRDLLPGVPYTNTSFRLSPVADLHLITTQCFLDTTERTLFASNNQSYLIKVVYEYDFKKVNKASKVKVESNGLVSSWMWRMQRDDVATRNEWSNYTNWPYEDVLPYTMMKLTAADEPNVELFYPYNDAYSAGRIPKNLYITGNSPTVYQQQTNKAIMQDFAIVCDGKYRENVFSMGVYDVVEKYTRSQGNAKEGLYFYNFALTTDPTVYQPCGAFNTNKFKTIEFEYNNVANPPIDLSAVNFQVICDPVTNLPIGVTKEPTSIYSYNYNLHIYEERYNVLLFQSGVADLIYSR